MAKSLVQNVSGARQKIGRTEAMVTTRVILECKPRSLSDVSARSAALVFLFQEFLSAAMVLNITLAVAHVSFEGSCCFDATVYSGRCYFQV